MELPVWNESGERGRLMRRNAREALNAQFAAYGDGTARHVPEWVYAIARNSLKSPGAAC